MHIGSHLKFETNQEKINAKKVDIKPNFCSECNTPLENFTLINTRQTYDIVIKKNNQSLYLQRLMQMWM